MLESSPLPSPAFKITQDASVENADVIVLGIDEDGGLSPSGVAIDQAGNGCLKRMFEYGGISGKSGKSTLISLTIPDGGGPKMALLIGIGDQAKVHRWDAFNTSSNALRQLIDQSRTTVTITLAECFSADDGDAVVSGALFGCEGQAIYQTDSSIHVPGNILFSGLSELQLNRGTSIGKSINLTRRLVNEPPSVIYPESFANRVADFAKETALEIEIWDENRLESEGCRAMLAVGQGSSRPPRLLIMRHQGGPEGQAPIALVGKGVTFDSGGLSIKPSAGMVDMKCDMAGAATVAGVMLALDELKTPQNVIGFCGLAENMVSDDCYRLGDVIKTRNGTTIEIRNTDAEGRVVLADTLDVAVQHKPAAMVDLATLTGACLVALGTEVAGAMTNCPSTCQSVRDAAAIEGEPIWELPMFSLYDDQIKSKVADIKNVGEGRWGGAITAAKFLEKFVGDTPWVHLDIAGPAFADSPKPHRDAGGDWRNGSITRSMDRINELIAKCVGF